MKYVLMMVMSILLMACAASPQTPAQSVYMIQNDFRAALVVAVAYKELPKCGTGIKLCSDPSVVHKLQDAYDVANASLTAAQTTVRVGGSNAEMAVTAAKQAVLILTAITKTLEIK